MDKKEALVTQLIRESLSGNLQWQCVSPPSSLVTATNSYVSIYFQTTFRGSDIGVYQIRHRQFTDVDEYYWSEYLGICIVNRGYVLWKSEDYSPSLKNLFDLASEQGSGIDHLLSLG